MLTALGVDVVLLYVERRHLQGTADLSALAGAVDLPHSSTAADAATAIAMSNGFQDGANGVSVLVETPYDGTVDKIAVTVSRPVNTYFLTLVGMNSVNVSARAVAYRTGGGYAIFAKQPNCSDSKANETIQWSGSNVTVNGHVYSNTGFKLSGNNNYFNGSVAYGCHLDVSGSSN
jgi:hypothetical protein